MRISDWSSDVCSSDLLRPGEREGRRRRPMPEARASGWCHIWSLVPGRLLEEDGRPVPSHASHARAGSLLYLADERHGTPDRSKTRSEERSVGNECVSTCRSWWVPIHSKKKKNL